MTDLHFHNSFCYLEGNRNNFDDLNFKKKHKSICNWYY